MPTTIPEPARVFWCEQTPDVEPLDLTISQAVDRLTGDAVGPDPADATAARILHTNDGGKTYSTWAATLIATASGSVKVRHLFTTGDLVLADTRRTNALTVILTIGEDYPSDELILKVIP